MEAGNDLREMAKGPYFDLGELMRRQGYRLPRLVVALCKGKYMSDPTQDIVDTAVAAGSFNTLVAAVTAAGLVDTLKSVGPFTVFAPSDAAFAALPTGTVQELVKPENKDKLTAILLLHVLPGAIKSADIAGKKIDVVTAGGAIVHVDATNGVIVEGAKVETADIACSNGVIHVVDTVILPKG